MRVKYYLSPVTRSEIDENTLQTHDLEHNSFYQATLPHTILRKVTSIFFCSLYFFLSTIPEPNI